MDGTKGAYILLIFFDMFDISVTEAGSSYFCSPAFAWLKQGSIVHDGARSTLGLKTLLEKSSIKSGSWTSSKTGISQCAMFNVKSRPLCRYYVITLSTLDWKKKWPILSKKPTCLHIFYLTPYRRNQIQVTQGLIFDRKILVPVVCFAELA